MTNKRDKNKKVDEEFDDRLFRSCFTLHPPDKDYPVDNLEEFRAYYAEVELTDKKQHEAGFHISLKSRAYHREKNPIYAIEAFILAHKAGLYPPIWALDFMAEALNDYHKHQGKKSLDKCLGLTRGRGQCSAFQEVHNGFRDEMFMVHVGNLQILFGCSVDEACHMVARMFEEVPGSNIKHSKRLSMETIKDKYYDYWKNIVGPRDKYFVELLKKWSEEEKVEYLNKFPEDSLPPKLKHLLS